MLEEKIFNILLPVQKAWELYKKIGNQIKRLVDFNNESIGNEEAYINTLSILENSGVVVISNDLFKAEKSFSNYDEFCGYLYKFFLDSNSINYDSIFNTDIYYDSFKNDFYIIRNSIKLNYSGLVMFLLDLKILSESNGRLYFADSLLIPKLSNRKTRVKPVSEKDLNEILEVEKTLGNEAEEKALVFECHRLKSHNIIKEPMRISVLDSTAGFDIASYNDNSDVKPTRFIEVKSVDNSNKFFISENEISKSKLYGNQYFLYLYNREKKSFVIIQNPYQNVFNNEKWKLQSKLFECKKVA